MADEEFPWHLGVYDAHCHPTDSMSCVPMISNMKARALTIMATRLQDQALVSQVAEDIGVSPSSMDKELHDDGKGCQVVPSFGWHPWFSHQMYDSDNQSRCSKRHHYASVLTPVPDDDAFVDALPEPRPLAAFLTQTRKYLLQHPLALVGEIGLDRFFRIPNCLEPGQVDEAEPDVTPGSREGRRLSPYRVSMDHQVKVMKAQLKLAAELGRAVSVHGVAAHGAVFNALQDRWRGHENPVVSQRTRKRRGSVEGAHADENEESDDAEGEGRQVKPYPPRICLHSYSGPPEQLKQYLNPAIPATVFFSFSQVINFSTAAASKAEDVIRAVPADRVLVESDLHCAGERMDNLLEEMTRKVCALQGWSLAAGVEQLARNWNHFVLGQRT